MEERMSGDPTMTTAGDFNSLLPLPYYSSEPIPPSPNYSESGPAIDFLPDFAGYAWVGYGASSLLVISHVPSPVSSDEEDVVGPIFRQVLEISGDDPSEVNAVSWSTATSSNGEIAAAAGNHVFVYSADSRSVIGSFCWSQTAVLVQAFKVVAIKWTGSGDGIITGGSEVVLWRKQASSWERAWKFKTNQPQIIISSTWSIEGPSATAPGYADVLPSFSGEAKNSVLVFQSDGNTDYTKAELCHPQLVSMIQWRPITGRQLNREVKKPPRHVLVTCCRDGTVRLWCETDTWKPKKFGQDGNDHKKPLSFCVAAVIEINLALNGTLGTDIFMTWPTEIEAMAKHDKGVSQCLSTKGYEGNSVPGCEWLIGFGPGTLITFWAIHCLDDYAPVRFPRVTLWKKQKVQGLKMESFCMNAHTMSNEQLFFNRFLISRNRNFAPPIMCSLIRLLPSNSLGWSLIKINPSNKIEEEESLLSCQADRFLSIEGHCGKILKVAVHPYSSEIELAASLDSNGVILIWSLSSTFNSISTLNYPLKLCGKLVHETSCPKYTSLRWVSSVGEDQFLIMGHAEGIDCFIVKNSHSKEDKIAYQSLFTIPFTGHPIHADGPTDIFTIPLHSYCNEPLNCNKFILLGIWMNDFQALSWEINICKCTPETKNLDESGFVVFEQVFSGKKYCINVNPCSSQLPILDTLTYITSFAVVTQGDKNDFIQQNQASNSHLAFHLATGCSDGSVKLWKSNTNSPWELVGAYAAHKGHVIDISLSDYGQKIATLCMEGHSKDVCSVHIWDSLQFTDSGNFIQEGIVSLDGTVIALNWLATGNGQSILGICKKNELRIYAQHRCGDQSLLDSGSTFKKHIWVCIAFAFTSPIYDFLWGPSAVAVVVHGDYFRLIGPWLFVSDKQYQGTHNTTSIKDYPLVFNGEKDENNAPTIFSDFTDTSINCKHDPPVIVNLKSVHPLENSILGRAKVKYGLVTRFGRLSILEVTEQLLESLPMYHPVALLFNICSGNWKRAHNVLQHLAKYLTSTFDSEKKYSIIPQMDLPDYFEGNSMEKNISLKAESGFTQFSYNSISYDSNISVSSVPKNELSSYIDPIGKYYDLEGLPNLEKTQIFSVIDLLNEISNTRASVYSGLDKPGQRFWVAVRFRQLYFSRRVGRLASAEELLIDSSLFAWAFHSDCQENLFSSILSNEPTWQEMRNMGVGFWLTDITQLRAKMEKLARLQYLKNRDPKACALLYIALKRINVLAGLFKISKDEKDKPLVAFLSRNFEEEKNKAAAMKNAYVLMGRHQLELAIAFFLLGGDFSSAITVCAKNLGDEQLALVISRLIEGQNGPLERQLITKYILPSAIDRGDYWLASLLEWESGNYLQSFLIMLGDKKNPLITMSTLSSLNDAYFDPSIGQYCLALATKNNMRNVVDEQNSAILVKWATSMMSISLSRCGLPLEGLECLPSFHTILGGTEFGSKLNTVNYGDLHAIIKPLPNDPPNWLSGDIAYRLEAHSKLNLAMKYFSKLMMEHPCCSQEYKFNPFQMLLENFQHKIYAGIVYFEQKFSLSPAALINMILSSLCNKRLFIIGYDILHGLSLLDKRHIIDSSLLDPILPKLLLKATKEISCLCSQFIVTCNINSSQAASSNGSDSLPFIMQSLMQPLLSLRAVLRKFYDSCEEALGKKTFSALDMVEYCLYFGKAWFQKNVKDLILIMQPILIKHNDGPAYDNFLDTLKNLRDDTADWVVNNPSIVIADERWKVLGACSLKQIFRFITHQLDLMSGESECFEHDVNNSTNQIRMVSMILVKSLKNTFQFVSSHHANQLTLMEKLDDGLRTLTSLKHLNQGFFTLDMLNNEDEACLFDKLWDLCVDFNLISEVISQKNINWVQNIHKKTLKKWADLYEGNSQDPETEETYNQEAAQNSKSFNKQPVAPRRGLFGNGPSFLSSRSKDAAPKEDSAYFKDPKEIYKRNGELFEALCINSIDQRQAALASNRKGILFFNWKNEEAPLEDDSDYIWPRADWPQNGWAGSESTPIPTCVSPGVGLGTKKGSLLGLGGATVGTGSTLARPGKDLTGGAAFGIPGYAGMSASGLGWETQEDFEEFVDPPANVENISTRAFSSHPSMPFFLVGSRNTHVYLWEFGKNKAIATYGVLPAANVSPPYALASISALQFDHCGHRFATAAQDGTVCTWQLEVGGRSNVRPTESSLCFNSHASDVTYVTSSGSIIAAAGYSTDGINVVVWDTLAPLATSRASIMCHAGGARSLSVFDNDFGSGSVSPLIVTGGKGGDVALHDFRYIATGKTKRNKHFYNAEHSSKLSSTSDTTTMWGQNINGMLWYLPKAHLGSVTKISTIPNTSLFLTGSKDGDVKLWDAKKMKLVHHWAKVHERHTFLQPATRGFGGVVQAAVTDIQVLSHGFLSCGGDGSVKLIQLKERETTP